MPESKKRSLQIVIYSTAENMSRFFNLYTHFKLLTFVWCLRVSFHQWPSIIDDALCKLASTICSTVSNWNKKIVIQFVHEFFRMGTGVSCVKTTKVEPFVYHEEDSTSTTGSRIIKIIQSLHQIYYTLAISKFLCK